MLSPVIQTILLGQLPGWGAVAERRCTAVEMRGDFVITWEIAALGPLSGSHVIALQNFLFQLPLTASSPIPSVTADLIQPILFSYASHHSPCTGFAFYLPYERQLRTQPDKVEKL
jgi:hypothetical protein